MRRRSVAAIVVTLIFVYASAAPSAAAAEPSPDNPQLVGAAVVPMTAVGFDPAVAISNGYAVVYDHNGKAALSNASLNGAQSGAIAAPQDVVNGNCGNSWVWLYDVGRLKYRVDTGFSVVMSAVHYSWKATVGGYPYTWSGGWAFRYSWQASATGTVSIAGYYLAYAYGSATLSNGVICKSLDPEDGESLY